jgi:putative pyruvate formate lyase activating enzyme
MHRQVGDLVLDERGLAVRGLLVRHLVLPGDLAGTRRVLEFLSREISRKTYVNLMDQYRPCYRAEEIEALARPISRAEWNEALAVADAHGLTRLDVRGAKAAALL